MESIYKQMNAINDIESLNEKYNVSDIHDVKKLNENYFDEPSEEHEERAADFYTRAEEELEKYFNCTGAFLEPSTQCGRGGVFLYADDMSFDGSVDYETSEQYIEDDDFEGFLQLFIDAFTPEEREMDEDFETDGSVMADYGFEAGENDMNDLYYYKEDSDDVVVTVHGNDAVEGVKCPDSGRVIKRPTKVTLTDGDEETVLGAVEAEYEMSSFGNYYVLNDARIDDKVWKVLNDHLKASREQNEGCAVQEAAASHDTTQLPEATWTIEVDGDILGTDYDDQEEAEGAFLEWCEEEGIEEEDVEYYIYQDFRSLDKNALARYLADKFEDTYRHKYQYYKKFKEDIERFILDNYSFPEYQHNDIEVASYDIAYNMTEILEERTGR